MLRVLYLTMNPNRQSTTVPTEGWFRFLPEHGLQPVLVSRERGTFDAWASDRNIPTYQDALPFPDKRNPLAFMGSLWRLRRIVRRHRIQLIHCNEQEIYPIAAYLGALCHVQVVVSVHFTMDREFCEWTFSGWKVPARCFFVSRRNLEACRPAVEGVIPESHWRVLHNGLDLEAYRPDEGLGRQFRTEYGLGDDFLVGTACAFRERKQLEHLFDATARIRSERLKVVLAGFPVRGEENYAAELLDAARNQLGERLCFVGSLTDLRGLANALDLFINTSREESFGISVLEALACGCPVLGYDSRAVDEVVLPDGGQIVEQDNVSQLTEAIEQWLTDGPPLRTRRAAARRQAERFDLRALSKDLWREYVELTAPLSRETR